MNGIFGRAINAVWIVALFCAACAGCEAGQAGYAAPPWTLTDIDGTRHSLSQYEGQVVVLAFWSSDDMPSRLAVVGVQSVHERFLGRGAVVLGISIQLVEGTDAHFDPEHYTFTQLVSDGSVDQKYDVDDLPTFVVIGPEGGVVLREEGYTHGVSQRLGLAVEQQLRQHGM